MRIICSRKRFRRACCEPTRIHHVAILPRRFKKVRTCAYPCCRHQSLVARAFRVNLAAEGSTVPSFRRPGLNFCRRDGTRSSGWWRARERSWSCILNPLEFREFASVDTWDSVSHSGVSRCGRKCLLWCCARELGRPGIRNVILGASICCRSKRVDVLDVAILLEIERGVRILGSLGFRVQATPVLRCWCSRGMRSITFCYLAWRVLLHRIRVREVGMMLLALKLDEECEVSGSGF